MKKFSVLVAILCLCSFVLAGCGGKSSTAKPAEGKKVVLKVGATAVPHAEILAHVKEDLAKEGVELKIIEFSDYVQPNMAVADKELDANFFQHTPYLESFCKERKVDLVNAAGIHIEPMGVYSKTVKNLAELPAGASVAIPNDPTNGGRALSLLEKAGLLKLKDGVGIHATVGDVVENPKNLKFNELEAAQIPRVLNDVVAAVINTNYALEAKLIPAKDALFIEQKDSPYVNIVVTRRGDETRPEIQKLVKALKTEKVKKFIAEKYKGAIVAAF